MFFVGPSLLPCSARQHGGAAAAVGLLRPALAGATEVVQCSYIYRTRLGRKMLKRTEPLTSIIHGRQFPPLRSIPLSACREMAVPREGCSGHPLHQRSGTGAQLNWNTEREKWQHQYLQLGCLSAAELHRGKLKKTQMGILVN